MNESTETKPTLEVWVEDTNYIQIKDEKEEVGDSQIFDIKMEADDDTLTDNQSVETKDGIVEADDKTLAEEQLKELKEMNSRKSGRKRTTLQKPRNSIGYYPASLSQRDKQFMGHQKSVLSTAKKTTTKQFEVLIAELEKRPELARGAPTFGPIRAKFEKLWLQTATKINAHGPPHRTAVEWKKIWADLKSRTKKKLTENQQGFRESDGRPLQHFKLTEIEQKIDRLFSFHQAAHFATSISPKLAKCTEDEIAASVQQKSISTEPITPKISVSAQRTTTQTSKNAEEKKPLKRKSTLLLEQIKLMRLEIKNQKLILKEMRKKNANEEVQAEMLQMQADAAKIISEAVRTQAEACKKIAEASQIQADAANKISKSLEEVVRILKKE